MDEESPAESEESDWEGGDAASEEEDDDEDEGIVSEEEDSPQKKRPAAKETKVSRLDWRPGIPATMLGRQEHQQACQ